MHFKLCKNTWIHKKASTKRWMRHPAGRHGDSFGINKKRLRAFYFCSHQLKYTEMESWFAFTVSAEVYASPRLQEYYFSIRGGINVRYLCCYVEMPSAVAFKVPLWIIQKWVWFSFKEFIMGLLKFRTKTIRLNHVLRWQICSSSHLNSATCWRSHSPSSPSYHHTCKIKYHG